MENPANIIPFEDPGPQPVFRQISKENLDNGTGLGAVVIGRMLHRTSTADIDIVPMKRFAG